jgi:hypothetical protein
MFRRFFTKYDMETTIHPQQNKALRFFCLYLSRTRRTAEAQKTNVELKPVEDCGPPKCGRPVSACKSVDYTISHTTSVIEPIEG